MNIVMDLDKARLGILPALTKMVEWGVGDTQGKIRLAGTLEEPLLFGSVKIAGGSVKAKYINTVFDDINLDVVFNGNTVQLKNLSTKLGKGTLSAEGSYALHTDADTAYSLHIKADKAQLASKIFTGTITSDVTLQPEKYPDMKTVRAMLHRLWCSARGLPAVCVWMMFLLICRRCLSWVRATPT